MLNELFATFRPPSADLLAQRELDQAERLLLQAHTSLEYAQAMVNYHTTTANRLKARKQQATVMEYAP